MPNSLHPKHQGELKTKPAQKQGLSSQGSVLTFVRRLQYETNSEDVRRQFEEYGEIKSFYDLVSSRGMVFVTYVSLSAGFLGFRLPLTCKRISLISELLSVPVSDCRERRSPGDL